MKKILTLAAVALLIFGLAAATYAVEFKASGLIRVRSALYMGTGDPGAPRATADNYEDTEAWMDSRMRLKMDLVANEDLKGVIYFEGDSSKWGEAPGGRNAAGSWGTDRVAVELKQFYIDFNVPGLKDTVPTNVRAGTQWLAIRSHVFLGVDGAGIRVFTNPGPVRVYLNWFKPWEGTDYQYDDTDLYAVRVVSAIADLPVQFGGFFAYWNSNDYNYAAGLGPTGTGMGGGAGLGTGGSTASTGDGEFWWLGFNVDGKIGPVALKTDFVYFTGEAEPSSAMKSGFGINDADYGGWLLYTDANAAIGPATVGGTFMYATGDDLTDTAKTSPDFDAYRVPPGSESNPSLGTVFWSGTVHDGIGMARFGRTSGAAVQQRKFGGLWTIKGYASFKPLDWLKVTGYGMYIGDTTDEGNTIGDARDLGASGFQDDGDIGIELGAIADIAVYKNLTYSMALGYLFAGDALDTWTGTGVINDSPDNPWAIVSQLIYKF